MKSKMNKKEFLQKCTWEGGSLWEGFEYGLTPDDLDDSDKNLEKNSWPNSWPKPKNILDRWILGKLHDLI